MVLEKNYSDLFWVPSVLPSLVLFVFQFGKASTAWQVPVQRLATTAASYSETFRRRG